MSDEEGQRRVIRMVDQINKVLAGEDIASACTALTISVASMIINTATSENDRIDQAREFAKQLEGYALRGDIVEWIKAHTTHISAASRRDQ
jgi:predicted DNA-binding protein with PD1-like motif